MSDGTPARLRRIAGEFTIIVLGVLVALFMESAWEDRQERQLAGEYLDRLREEARLNREQLGHDIGFNEANCQAAEEAYSGLAGATRSSEDLLRSVWVAALARASSYRTSTYEDLLASGRMGIIRDAVLRDRIIAFYEYDLDTWRPGRDAEYRRNVLRALPPAWTTGMLEDCASMVEMQPDWERCWVPIDGGAEAWVERVGSIPGILEQLADRTYDVCSFDRFLSEADSILGDLEAGLAGSP